MAKTCLNLFFAKFWKVAQKVAKLQSSECQKKSRQKALKSSQFGYK